MTSDRSYRRGLVHERAIEVLREYAGTQFDPRIVELFARLPRHLFSQRREQPQHESAPEPFEKWETAL